MVSRIEAATSASLLLSDGQVESIMTTNGGLFRGGASSGGGGCPITGYEVYGHGAEPA
jgi:hypothetical protein